MAISIVRLEERLEESEILERLEERGLRVERAPCKTWRGCLYFKRFEEDGRGVKGEIIVWRMCPRPLNELSYEKYWKLYKKGGGYTGVYGVDESIGHILRNTEVQPDFIRLF